MKISTLILAVCTLCFAACAGTPKKSDSCCAKSCSSKKTDACCAEGCSSTKACPVHAKKPASKKP